MSQRLGLHPRDKDLSLYPSKQVPLTGDPGLWGPRLEKPFRDFAQDLRAEP